jgi:LysM repeat protein
MTWNRHFVPFAAASFLLAGPALAQEAAASSPPAAKAESGSPDVAHEVGELRKAVDKQALQLEMLTRELSLLRQKLDGAASSSAAAKSTTDAKPAAPTPPEVTPAAPAPAPEEKKEPDVQRAEATGGGVKHIVAKGETLTSIAKQYNIPVTALQKANRIQDGRKLQIGVVLTIPSTPETSPEKKENP